MLKQHAIFDQAQGRLERFVVGRVLKSWKHSSVKQELNQQALLEELRAISRDGVIKAALAGTISGSMSLFFFWLAETYYPVAEYSWSQWTEVTSYLMVMLGGSVVATILELVYLYYIAVLGAQRMLALTQERELLKDKEIATTLSIAMTRAGLESPNSREIRLNINPLQGASKWRMFIYGLLYKLKILISTQAAKQIWKRVGPRLAGRSLSKVAVEAVSIPVFAFWDAFVCALVFREMRIRAQAVDKVRETIEKLYPIDNLTPAQECHVLGVLAMQIVLVSDFHPAVILSMDTLRDLGHLPEGSAIPDGWSTEQFLEDAEQLSEAERMKLAHLFALLLCLDRRKRRQGRRFLHRVTNDSQRSNQLLVDYQRFVESGGSCPVS